MNYITKEKLESFLEILEMELVSHLFTNVVLTRLHGGEILYEFLIEYLRENIDDVLEASKKKIHLKEKETSGL